MKTDKPLTLPNSAAKQIVAHWTGGSYAPSSMDKHHYHFLIDGDGVVHHGEYPIDANDDTIGGEYAAHVRNWNTRTIGLAVCCMFGAKESPFDPGKYPIKWVQWDTLAELTAALCKRYDIPVDNTHVLMHSEVEQNIGVKQAGKWDINAVPNKGDVLGVYHPSTAGNTYRLTVETHLRKFEPETIPGLSKEHVEKMRAEINKVLDKWAGKFR